MDGRAFHENVKSFCQSRGASHFNVQQLCPVRWRRRRGAVVVVDAYSVDVAATSYASTAAVGHAASIAQQDRFAQTAGQPIVRRFGETLQHAQETVVRFKANKERQCQRQRHRKQIRANQRRRRSPQQ